MDLESRTTKDVSVSNSFGFHVSDVLTGRQFFLVKRPRDDSSSIKHHSPVSFDQRGEQAASSRAVASKILLIDRSFVFTLDHDNFLAPSYCFIIYIVISSSCLGVRLCLFCIHCERKVHGAIAERG